MIIRQNTYIVDAFKWDLWVLRVVFVVKLKLKAIITFSLKLNKMEGKEKGRNIMTMVWYKS